MEVVYNAQKKEYTCTVEFTEGSEQRITQAFVDLYYRRQRGLCGQDNDSILLNNMPEPNQENYG